MVNKPLKLFEFLSFFKERYQFENHHYESASVTTEMAVP